MLASIWATARWDATLYDSSGATPEKAISISITVRTGAISDPEDSARIGKQYLHYKCLEFEKNGCGKEINIIIDIVAFVLSTDSYAFVDVGPNTRAEQETCAIIIAIGIASI